MNTKSTILSLFTKAILSTKLTRGLAAKQFEKMLYTKMVEERDPAFGSTIYSKKAVIERFNGLKAMLHSFIRGLNKGHISRQYAQKLMDTLINGAFLAGSGRKEAIEAYKKRHGIYPPVLFALSPTQQCNLECKGCYASSLSDCTAKLEWDVVDKIIQELHDEVGMRFFVISGGEPLMYRSQGKTILDLPRKYKDSFFLMYTNGTLLDEKIAKEMAELGNITPAISVEGFEQETDARRSAGVHKKILQAFDNLRKAGVMFGVSVTSTKDNIDVLLTERFYDYYFEEQGASYMWMFQYMPIGRKFSTELAINPEQRFELFKMWRKMLSEKQYYIADFWNSGILCSGCISCSREGGYFYIDWNGNIMPCVFIPYYKDNVKDLFAKGKKIQDALFSDLFVKGREWQTKHFDKGGKVGNLLMPCLIRDNHKDFMKILSECKDVKPEDKAAGEALNSKEYHDALIKFDEKLKKVTEPAWKSEYE